MSKDDVKKNIDVETSESLLLPEMLSGDMFYPLVLGMNTNEFTCFFGEEDSLNAIMIGFPSDKYSLNDVEQAYMRYYGKMNQPNGWSGRSTIILVDETDSITGTPTIYAYYYDATYDR